MNHYLNRCIETLEQCTTGVSAAPAEARVDGHWSVIDIVEHLQLTYSGTAKGFERCLEAGAPNVKPTTLKEKIGIFVVVTVGYFPSGREAPKFVLPKGGIDLATAVDNARRDLEWLDRTATQARERFGASKVLGHPLLGALTVDQWLRFHWIHTRHHERQIRARRGR